MGNTARERLLATIQDLPNVEFRVKDLAALTRIPAGTVGSHLSSFMKEESAPGLQRRKSPDGRGWRYVYIPGARTEAQGTLRETIADILQDYHSTFTARDVHRWVRGRGLKVSERSVGASLSHLFLSEGLPGFTRARGRGRYYTYLPAPTRGIAPMPPGLLARLRRFLTRKVKVRVTLV